MTIIMGPLAQAIYRQLWKRREWHTQDELVRETGMSSKDVREGLLQLEEAVAPAHISLRTKQSKSGTRSWRIVEQLKLLRADQESNVVEQLELLPV